MVMKKFETPEPAPRRELGPKKKEETTEERQARWARESKASDGFFQNADENAPMKNQEYEDKGAPAVLPDEPTFIEQTLYNTRKLNPFQRKASRELQTFLREEQTPEAVTYRFENRFGSSDEFRQHVQKTKEQYSRFQDLVKRTIGYQLPNYEELEQLSYSAIDRMDEDLYKRYMMEYQTTEFDNIAVPFSSFAVYAKKEQDVMEALEQAELDYSREVAAKAAK